MTEAISFFFTLIVTLVIFSLLTGLVFYPLTKNISFVLKYKYIILLISLMFFIPSLISLGRNIDSQQDPDYNADNTYNILLISWCFLSTSLFLIFFNHKK